MKAEFEDEDEVNDGYIIVFVTDNSGVVHELTFEESTSDIVYHGQDGYPDDPASRSPEGHARVSEARRYARWYVHANTDHDALAPYEVPSHLAAVSLAIQSLDDEQLEAAFGDLYRQLNAEDDPGVDAPVDLPRAVRTAHAHVFEQDAYLGTTPERAFDDALDAMAERTDRLAAALEDAGPIGSLVEAIEAVGDAGLDGDAFDAGVDLEATSGVHVRYHSDPASESERLWGDRPLDREPDARLSLEPAPIGSLSAFRVLLVHNLACQIRDCYLGRGEAPPEPFRVLGRGQWEMTLQYGVTDFYEPYHEYDADVPGYVSLF